MPIHTLLLDADGVIQRPAAHWDATWRALLPESRRTDRDLRAFFTDIWAAELPALSGACDISEALAGVLEKWDCLASAKQCLDAWTLIDVQHDVLRVIDELRGAGLAVHLATNQQAALRRAQRGEAERSRTVASACAAPQRSHSRNADNQQAHRAAFMSETLGYRRRFEREYYSCRIGAAKPSRAYFQHILDDLACKPESVLFVDDVAANVEAARQLGIHAVQHHLDAGLERFVQHLAQFGIEVLRD